LNLRTAINSMKIVKFLIAAALTTGLVFLLNSPNPFGSAVPAMGALLNPFSGFWQNANSESQSTYKNRTLEGLESNVEIVYSDRLVPHIFAENLADAYFAQGYITAKHRLWQMDFSTRATAGRLSEVLGEITLEYDRRQRRRGLPFAAERAVQSWQQNEESFSYIQAYSDGVNAYIRSLDQGDIPLEFKLIGYQPELWSPYKTALMSISMAETLNFDHSDLQASNARQAFGDEIFDVLYPEYNPKQSPVIPVGTEWNFTPDTSMQELLDTVTSLYGHHLDVEPLPTPDEGIGSNNWAVSGSKTASGNPILCNDPHLTLSLPAIWFETQIQAPNMNAYGVSIPGIPGIIIGFNENVAWGVTNVGHDVLDWYNIDWANEKETTYYFDGEPRQVVLRAEQIEVRGQKTVVDTVRYTHLGPIVYENDTLPYADMAMRWLTHDAPNPAELNTFVQLNQADNYEDYSQALKNYDRPAQNFVFASKQGDIALKVNGKLPIKRQDQGRFLQDGSTSTNEWLGFIPKAQIPQVKNPERGFVSSANQRSTDASYPYYYNSRSFDDYRGRYINRRLEEMDSITVQDMMDLQNSTYSIFAEEAMAALLEYLDREKLNTVQQGLLKILEDWDYRFEADAEAPILFEEWWATFYKMTWDEVYARNAEMPMLFPENWRTIQLLQNDPLNIFWDIDTTAQREMPKDLVTQSFVKTCADLREKLEQESYTWEDHKSTFIAHLARIEPFGKYDLLVGGYGQAPNAIKTTTGPSWRMIVELGDEVKAWGVYPGGQSGHPGSKYYDNMIDTWMNGEYYELFFMKNREDTRQSVLFTQILEAK